MESCESHFLTLIRFIFSATEFFAQVYEVGVVNKVIDVGQNRRLVEKIHTSFQILKEMHLLRTVQS